MLVGGFFDACHSGWTEQDCALFGAMLEKGVVVVATSNLEPDDLYANGLQRERFLPAIALLKEKLDVLALDGGIDYLAWKITRHSGVEVAITPWQRRHPILAGLLLLPQLKRKGAVR